MVEAMGEISQDRIRSAFEQYSVGEYAGLVPGFEELAKYGKGHVEGQQKRPDEEFLPYLEARADLVDSLANLDNWDSYTVSVLKRLKSQASTQLGGPRSFQVAVGVGPDIWLQGVVVEAAFKRLWRNAAQLVTGYEREYQVKQDSEADQAGIDFVGTLEYDEGKYFVCSQTKSSNNYPVGQIITIDLTPGSQNRSDEDQAAINRVWTKKDNPDYKINRINQGAQRLLNQLNPDQPPIEKLRTVLVVIGVKNEKDNYSGWEDIMISIDSTETRYYFANKIDEILSGEKIEEPQMIEERPWHEGIFSDAVPTTRSLQYTDKEAKYEGYARRYPTDEDKSGFGPLFKEQKIETKQKPRRKKRF